MELNATSVFDTPSTPSINHIQTLQGLSLVKAKKVSTNFVTFTLWIYTHYLFNCGLTYAYGLKCA